MSWVLWFWEGSSLNTAYDKIQRKKRTVYIHKDFRSEAFEEALLAGEKELHNRYAPKQIPSSESARVYKFVVDHQGTKKSVYLKENIPTSFWSFIKNLARASRARRAFNATVMLAKHGFAAPAIVAFGEDRLGLFRTGNFIATLEVEDAKPIHQLLADDPSVLAGTQLQYRRRLIRALGKTVGRMHAAGIFHGDLRLGNVLARQEEKGWRLFFLDNERTRKFSRLPHRLRAKNLVQVNMAPRGLFTNIDRMRFFKEYCTENATAKEQKIALIRKILERTDRRLSEKKRCSRELRKCLRTNERYLRIKVGRNLAVFDRAFCGGNGATNPADFVRQIDALMDKGQTLKNDSTCCVSRLTWNDRDIVVKRYNHKGLIHSLRHTIKKARARRGWLHAHRLGILNIATPRPIGYIDQRRGLLTWKSYLTTEYVEGQILYHFLRDSNVTQERRSIVAQQVAELLDKLGKYRITHGDLKHSNVLITETGPVLTDLDAMKVYRCNWWFKIKKNKDRARLKKNTYP
jgi:tRNA A-37 threonylcarbamoyl transferase component Bud32